MLYGIVFRDYPKQVVSLAKAKSVPANMHKLLSLSRAQRQYRIDVTASTADGNTGGLASAGACPGGCKDFFSQRFERSFHHVDVQDVWYRSKGRTSSATTRPRFMFSSTHGSQGSNAHTRKTFCVDCGTYIDSVPREIYNALSRQHVQLLRTVKKSLQIV